jgi:hypothetical protein
MSVELMPTLEKKYVEVDLSGKLDREDYEKMVPQFERWIRKLGKLRLLVRMHNFHGWHAGALWEDIKFDMHHFADFERIAFVGEKKWQEYMSAFCKPFTNAKIRYFETDEMEKAKTWLES